jgi:hypothetical protein
VGPGRCIKLVVVVLLLLVATAMRFFLPLVVVLF